MAGRATEVTQLPTATPEWSAPRHECMFAEGRAVGPPAASPRPLAAPAASPRARDAVPRHLKPHAWDLASLGQEPPPRQAWPEPAAAPAATGARGRGPEAGALPAGTEAQLVERLAQRFVLGRKAPLQAQRERDAYRGMLQQVAWTALEPSAAQETALLLSQRWLEPVSSAETLRAFRRCLHAILCDDRVLDIVDHQMALHFSRTFVGAQWAPKRP